MSIDPSDPARDGPALPDARRRDALLLERLIDENMPRIAEPEIARLVLDAMRLKAELLGWLPPGGGDRQGPRPAD